MFFSGPTVIDGAIVVDGHVDTPLRIAEGAVFGQRQPGMHVDLPRMREGGVDAVFMAAWVDPKVPPATAPVRATELLEIVRRAVDEHDELELATSAADIERCVASGRMALLSGVENGDALGAEIANLERLHDLGARYLTLTWMLSNELADAAGDAARHGGLSPFGRDVVEAMNELGMLVDLAHASEATFWDALERSNAPVVVSHSGTEARGPHPRNLSDAQLRGLAENGGLIGINFFPAYLSPDTGEANWPVIVDHIDRAAEVAGVEHVALGSDLDGIPRLPTGFDGVESFPLIAAELEHRGYEREQRAAILGGNWLRVLDTATAV